MARSSRLLLLFVAALLACSAQTLSDDDAAKKRLLERATTELIGISWGDELCLCEADWGDAGLSSPRREVSAALRSSVEWQFLPRARVVACSSCTFSVMNPRAAGVLSGEGKGQTRIVLQQIERHGASASYAVTVERFDWHLRVAYRLECRDGAWMVLPNFLWMIET